MHKTGLRRLLFAALILIFNWPLLSIPASGALAWYLFGAWAGAIALLYLSARGPGDEGPEGQGAQPGESGPGEGGSGV